MIPLPQSKRMDYNSNVLEDMRQEEMNNFRNVIGANTNKISDKGGDLRMRSENELKESLLTVAPSRREKTVITRTYS